LDTQYTVYCIFFVILTTLLFHAKEIEFNRSAGGSNSVRLPRPNLVQEGCLRRAGGEAEDDIEEMSRDHGREIRVDRTEVCTHVGGLSNTDFDRCLYSFDEGQQLGGRLSEPVVIVVSKERPAGRRQACYLVGRTSPV
jgi:hypothetical protein